MSTRSFERDALIIVSILLPTITFIVFGGGYLINKYLY